MHGTDGAPRRLFTGPGVERAGEPGEAAVRFLRLRSWGASGLHRPQVATPFDLEKSISDAMARQARRSMRSLSASSLSSLSSLESAPASVCSLSSLTSLSSADGLREETGLSTDAGAFLRTESPQGGAPSGPGKRKRKRNAEKEATRQAKRRKEDPKRRRPRKEGVAATKLRQAMRQPAQTDVPFGALRRSMLDKKLPVPDLEAVKSRGLSVLPWDGV